MSITKKVFRPGFWSSKTEGVYIYERIYKAGHRWTPFCKRRDNSVTIRRCDNA